MAHEYEVSGTTYEFPDDFSDEKVQQILSKQGVIKGTGPSRQRNEGAGKPKTQETLEQGLSREGPIMRAMFTPVTGAIRAGKGAQQVVTAPTMREKARGATDVLRGGLDVASPYIAESLVTAPLKTFLALASGGVTSEAIEKGAEAVGVPDEYSELAGTAAGIYAGGKTAKELRGRELRPKASAPRDPASPRPPLGNVARSAYRGAKAEGLAPSKLPILKQLTTDFRVPATVSEGLAGLEIGGPKGAVVGAAAPFVRGAFKGAREAYRPTPPPPTAADTSVEAWEANKGRVAKQARKYTPGGAEPPNGPAYPKAKVKVEPEKPEPFTPVRGKPTAYKFTPGSEDFSPPSVKPKGPKPVEEPKVDKADYKLVRGKSSGSRSSGSNPGDQFSPPSARVKTRSSTPTPPGGEEAETTAAPTEKPAGEPTSKVYKDLPPKQYEDAVLGDIIVSRADIVRKLLDRPDAAKLAAKPRSWWADRKNWKGELGLKTAPSEGTLNAFLKGLGWTGAPPK